MSDNREDMLNEVEMLKQKLRKQVQSGKQPDKKDQERLNKLLRITRAVDEIGMID